MLNIFSFMYLVLDILSFMKKYLTFDEELHFLSIETILVQL